MTKAREGRWNSRVTVRKLLFLKESSGVVLFPVVLVDKPGGTNWAAWRRFLENSLLQTGMISADDLSLFRITSSVEEAVREIHSYYRVFHSLRYVGRDLAIRIRTPLSPGALAALDRDFRDLLEEGSISQGNALPGEADEPEIADLPRIVFRFNNGSHGRLRQLIDRLNGSAGDPH